MEYFVILLLLSCVAGGFSAFIACEKNSDQRTWFLLGFLFWFFPLIVGVFVGLIALMTILYFGFAILGG
jgi:hypothetical protein